jgi:hypothetical protein
VSAIPLTLGVPAFAGTTSIAVVAGLVPAIHAYLFIEAKTWMPRDKPGHDGERDVVFLADESSPYASPWVSNIAALMASAADLPAQTTNWNAG